MEGLSEFEGAHRDIIFQIAFADSLKQLLFDF